VIYNQFANSGLSFAQAAAAITPIQAQEIAGKFAADSNFQAFLHGQTATPVTIVGVASHDAQFMGYAMHHAG